MGYCTESRFRIIPWELLMRALALGWLGLIFVLAGCGAEESPGPTGADAKSAAECKTGECCATPSRASILQRNAAVKAAEKNQ